MGGGATVTILVVLAGLAAASLMVVGLLGPREIWDLHQGEGLLARLKKKRERLLRAMKDLETERQSGTLSQHEFRTLRNEYKRRTIAATRDLDRARRARLRALARGTAATSKSRRNRIEKLVRARKEES